VARVRAEADFEMREHSDEKHTNHAADEGA
jgi:hypothetical protein